ncbi:MAG: DUF3631 domain-containing protein [Alphaproteobacteria bacterium]|nr:DUF3631 domain-containing protein [Alphaproteobacteria bacterium]
MTSKTNSNAGVPESLADAAHFLEVLDPDATSFTFQTFDDNSERKDKTLAHVLHGTLAEHGPELQRLNEKGAGIFVTVNRTDGTGRKKENIVQVRAAFVDLDGAPLEPVMQYHLPPHIVTETSLGRWHAYWRVEGVPLDKFIDVQKALIARFGSDPVVKDLPRVMRLPGFTHRKGEPFLSRIISTSEAVPYREADFLNQPQEHQIASRVISGLPGHNTAEPEIETLCAAMATAKEGTRNHTLNKSAFLLGQLIGAGKLDEATVVQRLGAAARSAGLGDEEIRQAIAGGLTAGKEKPRLPGDGLTEEQQAEITQLAALPLIQYDQQRNAAATRLGIRVSTLDQYVERARPRTDEVVAGQGTPLSFAAIAQWPEPVAGEDLVADMETVIRKHVVLSDYQALAVALWIVHAHALEAAEHSPRLHVPSPAPRCGKTTLLNTIAAMVPKAIHTENITSSSLFRIIEMVQPTLLIDEADIFLKDNEEMRGLLNAGHSRSGQVIRTVGDDHEPRAFKVWSPVVVAGIGRIPATLEDRSITIGLRRRLPNERIERLRSNRTGHLEVLGRRVARWVADNRNALIDADPVLPENLGDRAQDNWRPLVAIADEISTTLGERVRAAAIKMAEEEMDNESAGIMALADVAGIFELKAKERLSSHDLITALTNMEDRPWSEWRRGQPLTKNGLARLLRPFGINPKQIRFEQPPRPTAKGYEAAPIREAKARYVDAEVHLDQEDIAAGVI